ncbi:hypothetical protein SAMN05216328_13737 [Ensifer sp. YR511]|nr:hypothetical protein SAMN05216328_13737 [Ensifer sp. YR511]
MTRKPAASKLLLRSRDNDQAHAFCYQMDRYAAGSPQVPANHNDATVTDITHQLPLIII